VKGDMLCTIQGFMLSYALTSTMLWNIVCATYVLIGTKKETTNITSNNASKKSSITAITLRKFTIVKDFIIFLSLLVSYSFVDPSQLYAPSGPGAWCFIDTPYVIRWWVPYGLILVSIIILFVVYVVVYVSQHNKNETKEGDQQIEDDHIQIEDNHIQTEDNPIQIEDNHIQTKDNTIQIEDNHILLYFPIALIITHVPMTVVRLLLSLGVEVYSIGAYFCMCWLGTEGIWAAVIYVVANKILGDVSRMMKKKKSDRAMSKATDMRSMEL